MASLISFYKRDALFMHPIFWYSFSATRPPLFYLGVSRLLFQDSTLTAEALDME